MRGKFNYAVYLFRILLEHTRHLPRFIPMLPFIFSSCYAIDDFQYGIKYNPTRQKSGSPLIKHNMKAHHCCGVSTSYEVDGEPDNHKPYHFSKTIRAITAGRVTEEKDIFRKNLDDTTVLQLGMLTVWIWEDNKLKITGTHGKIDRRTLGLPAISFINGDAEKYPRYPHEDLDLAQIDSVLKSWSLSRFDKE